jgi:hypothetical protein
LSSRANAYASALLTALGTAMLDANPITDADDDLDLSPGRLCR